MVPPVRGGVLSLFEGAHGAYLHAGEAARAYGGGRFIGSEETDAGAQAPAREKEKRAGMQAAAYAYAPAA